MMGKIKRWIFSHEKLYAALIGVLNLFGGSSFIKEKHPTVWLRRTKVINKGKGNRIIIQRKSILDRCRFTFEGSNNTVVIGERSYLIGFSVCVEGDGNRVELGERTKVYGATELACIEGCKIRIGDGCMFSSNIHLRTGDSHSIVDLEGKRINPSKDISLGDYVWVGQNVFVGKGVSIAEHTVVGACAVVTKAFDKPNVAIGGNPARIIKENIDWSMRRL